MIKAAAAKVTGRSHILTGMPCQDAVKTRNLRNRACIALADGAGSKRHSKTGANVLVKLMTHEILDGFDRIYARILESKGTLAEEIVGGSIRVLEEKAKRRHRPLSDYACTLLFFACDGNRYVAGHIGDGAIVGQFGKQLITLSEPQNGEYANTTFFVTDFDAVQRLRLYAGEFGEVLSVMLMSDGTAESLYNKSTGQAGSGVSRLLDMFLDISTAKMRQVLQANLDKVLSQKSADDCSIAALVVSPHEQSK